MNGRRSSMGMVRVPRMPKESRETTRSRNGSLHGAPASRCSLRWASTGRTTMSSWPSAAPSRTRSSRSHQGGVAAVVGVEGEQGVGPVAGPEVGDHVAAAEGVDRLLGVADQHQRHLPGEGALDDLPLHRVGVLELVDHDDRPAPTHPHPCRGVVEPRGRPRAGRAGRRSRGCRAAACAARARAPRRRRRRGGRRRWSRPAGRPASSRVRGLPTTSCASSSAWARVSSGRVLHVAEPLEVEVVDDLADQLVEVLDQGDAGVGVAGDAERAQHQLAELVGGGDRGRVEAGQRVAQPAAGAARSSSDAGHQVRSAARRRPGLGSSSASAALTSWSRTRSRSSWLAARLKVMSSMSSSSARPSAT